MPRNKFLSRLKQFYSDHIDPDGIQPIQAFRTAIAAIIAIIFYRAIDWSQSYWVLLSTILIIQTYIGDTPKQKWLFLSITGLAAAICTYLASIIGNNPIELATFLMLTTFISLYAYSISIDVGNVAFYVNIFCLSAGAFPMDDINSLQRMLCVLLGTAISLIVCFCCWPERLSKQIRYILGQNLLRLIEFNRALNDKKQDERAIAIRRNRMMRGLQRARKIIPKYEIQDKQFVVKIEYLYEIILQLSQLKRYLQKQKVLLVIDKELAIISRRINWFLRAAAKNLLDESALPDSAKFIHTLHSFEQLYERHLSKFNEEQFLAFTVYIDNIHKLEKIASGLIDLMKMKYRPL